MSACIYEGCDRESTVRHVAGGFCTTHDPTNPPTTTKTRTMDLPIRQRPWKCGHEQAEWNTAWRLYQHDRTRFQACVACEKGSKRNYTNPHDWPDREAAIETTYQELKMGRSRTTAKQAGARFERLVADYLAANLDDRIDRRVKTGAADKGDIGGVRTPDGRRVVIEAKDYGGKLQAGTWIKEAETERANDNAAVGVVVAKRRGTTNPAEQFVIMTMKDLVELLKPAH